MKYAFLSALVFPSVCAFAQAPAKKVLMEEFTATWCSFCPEAAVALAKLHKRDPRFIPIAIHAAQDNMSQSFSGDWLDDIHSINGFPTVFMDRRAEEVDPRDPDNAPVLEKQADAPAQVGIAFRDVRWDPATRAVSGTLTATLVEALTGDLRIGYYVAEDSVVGGSGPATYVDGKVIKGATEAGYDQSCDGTTARNWPKLKYVGGEILGYPHAHVARAAPFGVEGKAGSIPAQAAAGTPYSVPFSYTVPDRYDPTELGRPVNLDKISLIAFVVRKSGARAAGAILNSEELSLASLLSGTGLNGPARGAAYAATRAVAPIRDGSVRIHSAAAGDRTISFHGLDGRLLGHMRIRLAAGWNSVPFRGRGSVTANGLLLVGVR